jgi:hypothetical protein
MAGKHLVSSEWLTLLVEVVVFVVIHENRFEIWFFLVIHTINAINGSKQSLEHKGDCGRVVVAVDAGNIYGNQLFEADCLNKFGVKAVNVVLGHCIKLVSSDGLIRFIIYAFFKNAKKEFNFKGT